MFGYYRGHICRALAVLAVLGLLSLSVVPSSLAQSPLPPNDPKRGLIYDGLERDLSGPCRGMYKIKSTRSCTHGPDPAPVGVDVTKQAPPPISTAATTNFTQCQGDGVSGYRTQVIYAHAADVPDRYNTYLATFIQASEDANEIYVNSALETGQTRGITFVTDPGCNLVIPDVTLSTTGDDNFAYTINELHNQGYNRADRKYMVFVDANIYCGVGEIKSDDRATSDNLNNSGPSIGRTDVACWGGSVAAHEHMHNLGGVQLSAPHTSGGWHCVDEYDRMCYSDYPYYPQMQYLCPNTAHDMLFDCNHDDYFHTNPPAGSYLATHWNTAQNRFLQTPGVVLFPTQTPTSEASGQGQTWEQGVQFSASVNGQITHIRFWKHCAETGTHTGRLWSDTGILLASVSFTNETSCGWQTAKLSSPVSISAGVRYRATYNINSYVAKTFYVFPPPISNGPLTAYGSFYSTPGGSFPTTSSGSNLFADVVFVWPH
jgi:hypothetical protein